MNGNVLVLGGDERLRHALEFLVPGIHVKTASAPGDTEGLGTDVVVVTGPHAISDLNEVRVHPTLYATPVVLLVPGLVLDDRDWQATDVWPITESRFGLLDELTDQVRRLLARSRHPSFRRPLVGESLRSAS